MEELGGSVAVAVTYSHGTRDFREAMLARLPSSLTTREDDDFAIALLDACAAAGGTPGTVAQVSPGALAETRGGDAVVVDVRGETEWQSGHIAGALLIPLPELSARMDEIPAGRVPVTVCGTGSRSAVAASYLRSRGRTDAANLSGGMTGWLAAGLPGERSPAQG